MADDIDNGEQTSTEPEVSNSEDTATDQETTEQENSDSQDPEKDGDAKESDGDEKSKDDDKASDKDSDVPESYDLKAPEDSLLNDDAVKQVEETAKELGLTNEQAQKLLDQQNEAVSNYQKQAVDNWQKQQDQWLEAVKSDKELGGDNFDENIKQARTALDKFASKEFVDALDESGYGNHPELVRTFARIGKMLGEDSPLSGESNQGGKQTLAEKFYPSMNKGN